MTDVSISKKISRIDFLKLAGVAGTGFMLLPLVPLVKALGTTVPINFKPAIIKRTNMVGPDGVAVDKYGVIKLYPTKTGGLEWFNNWNNGKQRTLLEGDKDPFDPRFFFLSGHPNTPLFIDGKGEAIVKSQSGSARLFVTGPWLNTEMTVYVKGIKTLNDVQLRSRSNHEKECGFGNYVVNWRRVARKVSIEVEPLHPIYKRRLDEHSFNGFRLTHYVGFKQVTRTVDGNKVKIEGWFNDSFKDSMDQTKWVKQTEFTFDGNNVTIPVVVNEPLTHSCSGKGDMIASDYNKNTLWLHRGRWCWLRLNGTDHSHLKWFSIREIEA